jgi:NAD(P)-dependent dehydrogenase (short-subunit alcohol dehydrogenase family)
LLTRHQGSLEGIRQLEGSGRFSVHQVGSVGFDPELKSNQVKSEKDMRLEGKVALLTGGNAGIGKATAIALAKQGAKIAIVARRAEEGEQALSEIKKVGREAIFIRADVTKAEDCQEMVTSTVKAFGKLDIAFNNAGIGRAGKFVADVDEADFDAVMAVNVKGVFLSMKYEIPELLKAGGGAIINTSSIGGLIASQGQSAYQTSKHALQGLTKAAALEYAKLGIRVNAICPGPVRTPMVERWFAMPGVQEKILGSIPMGRIAEPEEIAQAVVYLASDNARFITGTSLVLDGGFVAQ